VSYLIEYKVFFQRRVAALATSATSGCWRWLVS